MAAGLDTLEIAKRLKGAGFDDRQAETMTGVLRDLRDADFSDLATKGDLARLEAATKADIQRLEAATKAELAALRGDFDRLETAMKAGFERQQAWVKAELARLDAKIDMKCSEIKADIIRWVFGIAFAQAALILTVLKLFPPGHP